MLITVIIINYLFPMNNCVVKASEIYKKILQICLRSFVNFHPDVNKTKQNEKREIESRKKNF